MKKAVFATTAALLIVLLGPASTVAAQGCDISIVAQPPLVNYPGSSLPSQGTVAFSEIVNVNYSFAFVNQTIILEYFNGTVWRGLDSFRGNVIGFTEADVGLDTSWAHQGENSIRAVSGNCTSPESRFSIISDPPAFTEAIGSYALAGVVLGLFYFFGKSLGRKKFILLAAGLYLAVAPFTGQRYDVYFLLSSGVRILQHVNPFDAGNPPVYPGALKWAYPPLYAVYSAFSFALYQLFTGATLPSVPALTYPGWATAVYSVWQAYIPPTLPLLVLLLKIPMVVSAIWTGVLVGRMSGDQTLVVKWVANPLVVLVATVWGQLDPIATLLAVGSIYMFQKGRPYHAYALASFGAAVKVWPVLLIPILLVVSLRREGGGALKPLLAILPALAVTLALYGAYGNLVESLSVFVYARGIPTYAGQFSVNGLTWQQVLFVLKAPPVPMFLVVGIPAYFAMLGWMYWRRAQDVTKWLTISILVFFLTYNYVNPQYFYWIIPLLMIRGRKLATIVFTALPLIFVALSYNAFYFVSPILLPDQFTFGASIAEQLKVSYFYGTSTLFILVAGLIPTVVYLVYLFADLRPRRTGSGNMPANV
ncbi:MAG: hypothetical protein OK438_07505 [Thaumarchaeota archaeon]|nr:hypothetical protein [Nitrososphaerota archaeon]